MSAKDSASKPSLAYSEQQQKLQVRIRAHERFSDFDLNGWLEEHLPLRPGHRVLDLGCGDGNHLAVLQRRVQPRGIVVGLDKSLDLIGAARNRPKVTDDISLWLLCGTFDNFLPFRSGTFDSCLSSFSIYYAANPDGVIGELVRVTRAGGRLILLGPTANNAAELYDFHSLVTGKRMTDTARERTDRLDRQFLPILRERCGEAQRVLLKAGLVFPSPIEFVDYYLATPLFDESGIEGNSASERLESLLPVGKPVRLNKEIVCLECRVP